MIYEIQEIDPIENEGVLVKVAYWYKDNNHGQRPPDFVEHHEIRGIPLSHPRPKTNSLGQYVMSNGWLVPSFRETDNGWERWEPEPNDPDHVWEIPLQDEHDMITQAVEDRARYLKSNQEKGHGLLPDEHRPRVEVKLNHPGNSPKVKGLKGKAKRL